MVDSKGRRPHIRIVAILTDIGCQNMCRAFTRCFDAVVTARAIAGDADMIEIRGQPTVCGMAVITIVATVYVGRVLAGCDNTIVTRATGANDLSMVNGYGRLKTYCAVAVFADICRLDVNWAPARGGYAVVA